jgi:hypothetical protein
MKPLKRDFSTTTSLTDAGCSQPKRPRNNQRKGAPKIQLMIQKSQLTAKIVKMMLVTAHQAITNFSQP